MWITIRKWNYLSHLICDHLDNPFPSHNSNLSWWNSCTISGKVRALPQDHTWRHKLYTSFLKHMHVTLYNYKLKFQRGTRGLEDKSSDSQSCEKMIRRGFKADDWLIFHYYCSHVRLSFLLHDLRNAERWRLSADLLTNSWRF